MSVQDTIRSASNPRVKLWASLLSKKGRDQSGLFLVEGPHLVAEALRSASADRIETVVTLAGFPVPEEVASLLTNRAEVVAVSEEVMRKCTDTVNPQGVFAVMRKLSATPEEVLGAPMPLVVALDEVREPGNVGTIIRSADAAGASAVVVGSGSADVYNPKTVRSTMGSLFHVPVAEADLSALLPLAASRGIHVIAAAPGASTSCYNYDFGAPTWIVMGNEARGVSESILGAADRTVHIPMPGRAESLNVAMAATVLLFEAVRQRSARMP